MAYRLFGQTMTSDFPFVNRMVPGNGGPDLTFSCVNHPPLEVDSRRSASAQLNPYYVEENSEGSIHLWHLDTCDRLSFNRVADFYIWADRVVCHLLDPGYNYLVEIYLLGTVMSFWLEKRGIPTLHAASFALDDRAVVFLSSNGGGKSSLAATFMQIGYPLLTDDILPVAKSSETFVGFPGYPQMRFWPDEAEYFLGHYEDLEIVHPAYSKRRTPIGAGNFGSFCDVRQPLACIYLPVRRDSASRKIEITTVARKEAVIELVRHSFVARIVETEGLQPERLEFFARMVKEIPVRRLTYPTGFQYLPAVRNAILEDLQMLKA